MDRKYNCQKTKDKKTNNDLQNTTQKTLGKNWAPPPPPPKKPGGIVNEVLWKSK